MPASTSSKAFMESAWDNKEFDWTGKSFYFVNITNLMGKPLRLGNKLEQLNREVRQNGYRTINNIILIQYGVMKSKVMIEVEKQEKYDAQVLTFETQTTADSHVFRNQQSTLSKEVKRLCERVYSRRTREPRYIYYWKVSDPTAQDRTVIFAIA